MRAVIPSTRTARVRSAVGVVLAIAAIAALLVVEPWSTTSYDLSGRGVWISDGAGRIGRVSTEVAEIDTLIPVDSGDEYAVLQDDGSVYVVGLNGITRYPSSGAEEGAASLTASELRVDRAVAGGGRVAFVAGDGVASVSGTGGGFDQAVSLGEVGDEGQVAVGTDGTAVAYDPGKGTLFVLAPGAAEPEEQEVGAAGEASIALVGSTPVVLDGDEGTLRVPGRDPIDVGSVGDAPRLQLSGPAAGEVLVAGDDGLHAYGLDGDGDRTVSDEGGSDAVRPATDGRCTYAAWRERAEVRCADQVDEVDLEGEAWAWQVAPGGLALNDEASQTAYVVRDGELVRVKPWPDDDREENPTDEVEPTPPNVDGRNPPVAVDDVGSSEEEGTLTLFARPGRVSYLDVLHNDYDPDRDPLTIAELRDQPEGVTVSGDATSLQVDLRDYDRGPGLLGEFEYRITDGTSAESISEPATVRVEVIDDEQNSPPRKAGGQQLQATVAAGASIEHEVLSAFWDREGDPMYLESASDPEGRHLVTSEANGWVDVIAGSETGEASIALKVNDIGLATTDATLSLDVKPAGEDIPAVPLPDVARIAVGVPTLLDPLANDYDPNGDPLSLGQVRLRGGGELADLGSVAPTGRGLELTPTDPGRHVLVYELLAPGAEPIEGVLNLEVDEFEGNEPVVARADIVQVEAGRSASLDVLANDIDPENAVLSILDLAPVADDDPTASAIRGVVGGSATDHRRFQVDASPAAAPTTSDNPPVTYRYTVWDGRRDEERDGPLGQSTIAVIVVAPPGNRAPSALRPAPIAVRPGSVARVPISSLAIDPDGDPLTLEIPDRAGAGRASSGGDALRFEPGPDAAPGPIDVEVLVVEPRGNRVPVTVTFDVTDLEERTPPVALDLEARVEAGDEVLIPIPLDGRDPDGDDVQVFGVELAGAERGEVELLAPSQSLRYAAVNADDVGEADISYTLIDATGQVSAPATVTVSTYKRFGEDRVPVAVSDRIIAAPSGEAWVEPAANDTDLDGDALTAIDPQDLVAEKSEASEDYPIVGECTADPPTADEPGFRITASSAERGTCSVPYAVAVSVDGKRTGTPQLGTIVLETVPDFAGLAPIASDDYVAATNEDTVDVDLLANDRDPDSPKSSLALDVDLAGIDADLDAESRTLTVRIGAASQLIRYSLTDPDGNVAWAFVRVPGRDGNLPPIAGDGEPILVEQGTPTTIELADYVVDPDGDELTFKVTALKGSVEARDGDTIVYTAVTPGYAGPAGLRVTATDDGEPAATRSFDLPVDIDAEENLPPRWDQRDPCRGLTVAVGWAPIPGSFAGAVSDPNPRDAKELTFATVGPATSNDVTLELLPNGAFTLTPGKEADRDQPARFQVAVRDQDRAEEVASCTVDVDRYPGPALQATAGEVTAKQDERIDIDVVALGLIQGADGQVTVEADDASLGRVVRTSGSTITYQAPSAVRPASTDSVRFTVTDEIAEEDREAQAVVLIKLQGPPGEPTAVSATPDLETGKVVVGWSPGANDGNPEQSFAVLWAGGGRSGSTECGGASATSCELGTDDGLEFGVDYTFRVEASNGIGNPVASRASASASFDRKTADPSIEAGRIIPGDASPASSVAWSWSVPESGTAIVSYEYYVGGEKKGETPTPGATIPGFANGQDACITVVAVSASGQRSPGDNLTCSSERPYGRPTVSDIDVVPDGEGDGTGDLSIAYDDNGRAISRWVVTGCDPIDQATQPARLTGCSIDTADVPITVVVYNDADGARGSTPYAESYDFRQKPTVGAPTVSTPIAGAVDITRPEATNAGSRATWYYWVGTGTLPEGASGTEMPSNPQRVTGLTPWTTVTVAVRVCKSGRAPICSDWSSTTATPWGDPSLAGLTAFQPEWNADGALDVFFDYVPPGDATLSDFTFAVGIDGAFQTVVAGGASLAANPGGGSYAIRVCSERGSPPRCVTTDAAPYPELTPPP